MGYGVDWLADNNNDKTPATIGWQVWNADSLFSAPEDIGIVIMQVISRSTKATYNYGVRHPDESTVNTGPLRLDTKSLLFCGARDNEVAGQRCQCETYRDGAQNRYYTRVYGGIRRDSCEWDTSPDNFSTTGSGWEEINIFNYGKTPVTTAFAILEVLGTSDSFGVRHPDDTVSTYYGPANEILHVLAPVRIDGAGTYTIEIYSDAAIQVFIRGWILDTNPGIFPCIPRQVITVSTSISDRSILQDGFDVTGGFFVMDSGSATLYYGRCTNPDWTNPDEHDIAQFIGQACSCDANGDIENRVENVTLLHGMIAFSGENKWPHHPGGVSNPSVGSIGGVGKDDIDKVGGTD